MRTRWLLAIALPVLLLPALARAAAGDAAGDPLGLALQLLQFIRTGHGTAAAGVGCLLFVWGLRSGLSLKWAFWKSPLGGYLLGFGVPSLLYFGTALAADQAISLALIGNVLAAGWTAAGGWEHLRDVINAIRGGGAQTPVTAPETPSISTPPRSLQRTMLLAMVIAFASGCHSGSTSTGTSPITASGVVKCIEAEGKAIAAGHSVLAIAGAVLDAISGGASGAENAALSLITTYGPEVVGCAIDGQPEPALGSGAAALPERVIVKHKLLEKLYPGKTFDHGGK